MRFRKSWIIINPKSKHPRMRLIAQELLNGPPGLLKCVLQPMLHGKPDATHPIALDWRSEEDLMDWIETSKSEGWIFSPTKA